MVTKKEASRFGGIGFFISWLGLTAFAASNIVALARIASLSTSLEFALCLLAGAFLSPRIVNERRFVLLHELKHAVVSNLVGNRWKDLEIGDGEGHFTYEYSKETKGYNAFISLAPYTVPLVTVLVTPAVFALFRGDWSIAAPVLSTLAFGIDVEHHLRSLGPHQDDLRRLRGGYVVGCLYILAANLAVGSVILALWSGGVAGLGELLVGLSDLVRGVAKSWGPTRTMR